jgi:putative membrane protein
MHATLLSAATWYWYAIFASLSRHRWHALFSLLVTGKLFCILGALFVFSPREILSSSLPATGYNVLQDQQLAGLAMLAACPATYIGAAFLVALGGLPRMRGSPDAVTSCPVRGAEQT